MRLSRWLDRLFRPAPSPARRRNRRWVPSFETLEERVTPTIWIVGTLADDGSTGSLRYILQNDAKANDRVVFSQELYSQAYTANNVTDPNGPATITLQQNVPGLNGGPLVLPADVNLVGPTPDYTLGYNRPLIAIDGSQLQSSAGPAVLIVNGTTTNSIPFSPSFGMGSGPVGDGVVPSGDGFNQNTMGRSVNGSGSGVSAVKYMIVENGQAGQAGVLLNGGVSAFLDGDTIENNLEVGVLNNGTANAYIPYSDIAYNGQGQGAAQTGWGGLYNQSGNMIVQYSLVESNVATLQGDGTVPSQQYGGGITNHDKLWVEDSTLWANQSAYGGGGIYNSGGSLYLHNATIANNQTPARGGGLMLGGAMNILAITNTIIADNSAQTGTPTFNDIYQVTDNTQPNYNTITSQFYRFNLIGITDGANLDWVGKGGSTNPPSVGGQVGIESYDPNTKTINLLPLLGTGGNPQYINPIKTSGNQYTEGPLHLAPNGGPTRTVALLAGSPAIDGGDGLPDPPYPDASANWYAWDDNSNLLGPVALGADQRGAPRPDVPGTPQDIGAFEYQGPAPAITVTPTTLPNAVVGKTYNNGAPVTLTASGGNGYGFTFTVTGGTFPSWLNLSNSGVLTGTAAVPATFTSATFTLTVTDSAGNSTTVQYTIATGVTITPSTLPNGIVGQAYGPVVLTAGNGTAPYTFTVTGAPAWLTTTASSPTETLSAAAPVAGTYTFTVKVTDSASPQGSTTQTYTLTIYPALTLTPASGSLPAATTNNLYTENFTASGGSGKGYTYSETGALPAGLSFNNTTGQLTGTPTATGTFGNIQVKVTDSAGDTLTNTYTLVVEKQITITAPGSLPLGTAGDAYNQTTAFAATGGAGTPYTFSATGLPGGMTLNTTTDLLTGTPSAGGTYTVVVTAKDSAGGTGSKTYTLTIDPALTTSPATLPVATVANAYSPVTLTPSGGSGSGYSLTVSGLPTGLSYNTTTHVISGTPASGTNGTYTVTVGITDGIGATGTKTYTLTVDTAPSATPTTLPYAAQGGPYTATLSGTGGSGSGYSFQIVGTNPVTGISLASNGKFSGSTSVPTGSYTITVKITDGTGAVGTQSFTINVEGPISISPATLTNGTVNTVYNQTTPFSASGGSGSFTLPLVESGTIPGLTFSSATNTFTGTPSKVGTFSFTITATDSLGGTGSKTYTLTVDPAVTLSPATLPVATVNDLYSVTLVGGGGSGTGYVYTGSGLPAWLSITGSQLTGTPTSTTGSPFSFSITVTDNAGGSHTNTYSLTVDPALTLSPSSGALPSTAQNDPYYQSLTGGGGSGTGFVYSLSGNVPTGLGISSNVLTGYAYSPPGTYSFTVTVTDSNGGTASQNYSLLVTAPISISPTTLPAGTLGNPYPATTLTATGGSGGYVFSETGALPAGISFSNGTFSGTPTGYGTFAVTVSATDSKGGTTTQPYSLVINFSLGSSANAKFVDSVYSKLLGRAADPASQVWVNMLNSGVAPSTIVLDIEGSTEYLADVVTGIYEQYLGRGTAGDIGATYWLNQLAHGQSIESVTANILSSQEYFNDKGTTNSDFVTGLYRDVLGRAPDSGGLSYWTSQLNAGAVSRYQAALGFLTSAEYRGDLVNGVLGWNAYHTQLSGYYEQFLYRTGSAAEQAGWVGALGSMSDQQVLAAIFGSAEGYKDNS